MEIVVFDYEYKVCIISKNDVVKMKWKNKHFEYHTLTAIFHGASNKKEEAELERVIGFFKIDKNNLINIKFIERFNDKGVVVNGEQFPVSREKLALLKSQLRKHKGNYH